MKNFTDEELENGHTERQPWPSLPNITTAILEKSMEHMQRYLQKYPAVGGTPKHEKVWQSILFHCRYSECNWRENYEACFQSVEDHKDEPECRAKVWAKHGHPELGGDCANCSQIPLEAAQWVVEIYEATHDTTWVSQTFPVEES